MLSRRLLNFIRSTRIAGQFPKYQRNRPMTCNKHMKNYATKPFIVTPFTFMGLWGVMQKKDTADANVSTKEILLTKADALFDQSEYKQIYDLLSPYKESKDIEILWRICRALYNMSKTASEVEAKKMIYEGYDLICTALAIQEDHYAVHKWMSIFLDSKSSYEGMKSRITQLYNVKKHMMKAADLNPKDATTLYMLGNWCYQVSDLAWYQRKIAAAIFAEPPVSSFEEALGYFEQAETIDPNFYSHNLLMLGKTLLKLKRKEEALTYLKRASEYPARNDEDHQTTQEALKLLKSL